VKRVYNLILSGIIDFYSQEYQIFWVETVFVDEIVWGHVLSALSRYTKVQPPTSYSVKEYMDFLLNEKVFNVLQNIDKHIEKILKHVSYENYRNDVKEVLLFLSRNIDKTREFIESPREDVKEILRGYVLRTKVLTTDEYFKYIVKYVPLFGEYRTDNSYLGYGVVMYPDEKELNSIEYDSAKGYYSVDDALNYILKRHVSIDVKNRILRIAGTEYMIPLDGLIYISNNLELSDKERNEIFKEFVNTVKPALARFGSVSDGDSTIWVDLSSIAEEAYRKYNLEITRFEAKIDFPNKDDKKFGVTLNLRIKITNELFGFSSVDLPLFSKSICKIKNCEHPIDDYTFFKTTSISRIPYIIENGAESMIEAARIIKEMVEPLVIAAKKYGYDLEYDIMQGQVIVKKPDLKNNIYSYVGIEFKRDGVYVFLDVEVLTGELHDKATLLSHRLETDFHDFSFYKYEGVVQLRKSFKYSDNINYDEILRMAEDTYSKVKDVLKDLKKSYSYEEEDYPPELHVALYITKETPTYLETTPFYVIARSIISDTKKYHEVIGSILNEKDINKLPSNEVIYRLVEKEYVKLGEDMKVYINNIRYTDLVKKYSKLLTQEEVDLMEKEVASHIFFSIYYMADKLGKSLVEILAKLNLIDEKIIRPFIKWFSIEEMATKINGTPLWNHLSRETKKQYLDSITDIRYIATIYFDEDLRKVFSDSIDYIESKLLNSKDPNIVTEIVTKMYPDKIEVPENAKIISKDDLYIIELEPYGVQVLEIGNNKNKFIVYDEFNQGFIIEARTVKEAIDEFSSNYTRLKNIANIMRNIIDKQERFELRSSTLPFGIVYHYVYDTKTNSILPINEKTLKMIKNEIERRKTEETANTVSA